MAVCISLVSSCAYESYPVNSSYGGGTPYSPYGDGIPYGNSRTVSDPTIPLILGASAIGAIAYYGKKKHDRRHDSNHYSHRNHYDHYSFRSNNYRNHRNNNVCYNNNSYNHHRNNYASNYDRRNHNISSGRYTKHKSDNKNSVRESSRNSAHHSQRNSTSQTSERRHDSQPSKPMVNRQQRLEIVSARNASRSQSSINNGTLRSRLNSANNSTR